MDEIVRSMYRRLLRMVQMAQAGRVKSSVTKAERAAKTLFRAQVTHDRAERRIDAATVMLPAIALQQHATELRLGDDVVQIGEDVKVVEAPSWPINYRLIAENWAVASDDGA